MVEMFVKGIGYDSKTGHPIVVLNDADEMRAIPIWIGLTEASAINLALIEAVPSRPMTHDLMLNIISSLGFEVQKVYIDQVDNETYLAGIKLLNSNAPELDGGETTIDARPSDAIALALRAKAPIFVTTEVLASSSIPLNIEKDKAAAEEFKKFLETLKPSDFKTDGSEMINDSKS